ncbi:GNAT family N-acetyltransferase [Microbacterium laevaniformans]|uniref:GNAT family N-acetyltransferase n=1 Tax=Microbacterium laevaniformans TaxID=36807 RepID=UPI0036333BB4
MSEITITTARRGDLPAAADVLAEAFEADPVLAAIVPPTGRRRTRLAHLFHGILAAGAFATGTVDLARADDGSILGVAAWEGPEARRGALRRLLRHAPHFVRALGWRGIPGALALFSRLERQRPDSPHWYLAEVGVSARARGHGVGGRLLSTQLDTLDTMRQSAYLESSTPVNRRLYRRLGFEELRTIAGIPGARPVGMLRSPAARIPRARTARA